MDAADRMGRGAVVQPLRAVALVVLDSVGVGEAPDAAAFGDEGSATLPHVAAQVRGISLPNLGRLGLGRTCSILGVPPDPAPTGAFGIMRPHSAGKDTTSGHWEIAGVVLDQPFPTYPLGFPGHVIRAFEDRIGTGILGNVAASGTEIIARLGEEHVRTGCPIVYTSADSVFQIAAHVEVIPLERLYEMCRIARDLLRGDDEVGRVIARPFDGPPGAFERIPGRHDYSVDPPSPTLLDAVSQAGLECRGVGKIADIFAGRGVTASRPTRSNDEGVEGILEAFAEISRGLIFANLVDFDERFGHRNDPAGYAAALEAFDARLPQLVAAMHHDDGLIITADHGNDPTTPSTDHSRENVFVLVRGPRLGSGVDVGTRGTYADCGATVADLLGVPYEGAGDSFALLLRD